MTLHARPHLSTHGRSDNHSAVAGVAYRLGLRLYDERAKTWHDFRNRRLGDHIAAALTIAPEGAPEWAMDPQALWNAVEGAEKRKDAQLARDYRIPIPLGVGLDEAKQMAIDMARAIVERLHTPVSIGLHRDADKTAFGAPKPEEKRGYHAHLYFPTRALEEIGQADGTSAWGLRTKFAFLTSRKTSSGFVEGLNAAWADLANRYAQEAGKVADYDHRSYERMGLDIEPQRTLGVAATAMERRGFWTRKGDELRGQIVLESEVLRATHAEALNDQHAQAVCDVIREGNGLDQQEGSIDLSGELHQVSEMQEVEAPSEVKEPLKSSESEVVSSNFLTGEPGSLLWRFRQAVPLPEDPDALRVYGQIVSLIRVVERLLRALVTLVHLKEQHEEDRGRRVAARLDTEYQADQARRRRSAAKTQLEEWEAAHPWRMAVAKSAGSKPAEWLALQEAMQKEDAKVQEAKATSMRHMERLDGIDQEGALLANQEAGERNELGQVLDGIEQLSPTLLAKLVSVSQQDERALLEAAKPMVLVESPEPEDMPPTLTQQQLAYRKRPIIRG
jgi:hypothetical protein